MATFFENPIFINFILPFLLVGTLLYAVLEKTKILGEDKKQINAIVSFIIAFIFVGSLSLTGILNKLTLFLTISVVVIFIALVLWGFVSKEGDKFPFMESKGFKMAVFIVIIVAVTIAVLVITGFEFRTVTDGLFRQEWSGAFWTNALYVVVIAAVIALILAGKSAKSGS